MMAFQTWSTIRSLSQCKFNDANYLVEEDEEGEVALIRVCWVLAMMAGYL